MDTLTYSIILTLVFFLGIFTFSYFETPRKTLDKGIRKLNKGVKQGVKQISNIRVLNTSSGKNPLILPENKGKNKDDNNMQVYVHEY